MDKDELIQFIVDRLSAAANRDDIIRYVCLRGRLDWQQAEALVADVEETYRSEIDRRHIPINLTSAVMLFLFGFLLTGYTAVSIFEPLLGRPLPDVFYLLNDFGIQYGLLPDTRTAIENLHHYGLLPDFWRTLYTLGHSFGLSNEWINAMYVLASGYFYWPLLLLGICSLIVGSNDFFKNLFRLTGR